MNIKKEFIKNTSYVTVAKLFENIFAYLIIIMITRYLGAEGLGQYSFIFSFVGLFFIFSDFGLTPMMTKDLAKDFSDINKYASNVLTLKLILTLASLLIYCGSLLFIGKENLFLALILAGFIEVSNKIFSFSKSILRVQHNGKVIALVNVGERLIALIGAFIVLPITGDLFWFVFVLFISYMVKSVVSYLSVKDYFDFSFTLNWKFLLDLLKKGYPFMFIGIFAMIYVRMDTVMLSFLKNDEVVGWYNAGYKLINVFNMFPALLLTFGFPLFSQYFAEDNKKALKNLFKKLIQISLIVIIPIAIIVFIFGQRIINLIYGINTIEAANAFNILIVADIFIYLTMIMGRLISAADKQKLFMKIAGVGAIINIVLNFILIPEYSLNGAGVATLITYVIMFLLMFIYIRDHLID